jgi:hypothetical protein
MEGWVTPSEYIQRAEVLTRREQTAYKRTCSTGLRAGLETALAGKAKTAPLALSAFRSCVEAHQRIIDELSSLNREFLGKA